MAMLTSRVTTREHSVEQKLDVTINDDDDALSMDGSSLGGHENLQFTSSSDLCGSRSNEKLCVVCGDRASGYHYNALSCEGCKGFFRRSVTRNAHYECKFGGNCMMDMWMRRKCQACRLRRCRDVGMKEVCLLNELQCVARSARRLSKKTTGDGKVGTGNGKSCSKASPVSVVSSPSGAGINDQVQVVESPLERLCEDHRQLIALIVTFQEQYELPNSDDIARLAELKINRNFESNELSDQIFTHMVEMTILVTRLIVEFAKHLPGFKELSRDDQVVLLKGSASEVMMLRTARRFDPDSNTVVFGDGTPFSRDSMAYGGLQEYVNCMFDFAAAMSRLAVDNTEYALLTAICIFSDRPGIVNSASVEAVQERYVSTLCAYIAQRRPNSKIFIAQLLMKLVELRTLSVEHSLILYRLTIERGSLPPLLQEYFDLPDHF